MKPACSRHEGILRQSMLPETRLSWFTQLPVYSTSVKLLLWAVIAFQKHMQHLPHPMWQQLHIANSSSGTTRQLLGYQQGSMEKAPEDTVTLHDDQQVPYAPWKAQRK